nr:hypothetical protein [Methanofollis tationis]
MRGLARLRLTPGDVRRPLCLFRHKECHGPSLLEDQAFGRGAEKRRGRIEVGGRPGGVEGDQDEGGDPPCRGEDDRPEAEGRDQDERQREDDDALAPRVRPVGRAGAGEEQRFPPPAEDRAPVQEEVGQGVETFVEDADEEDQEDQGEDGQEI